MNGVYQRYTGMRTSLTEKAPGGMQRWGEGHTAEVGGGRGGVEVGYT